MCDPLTTMTAGSMAIGGITQMAGVLGGQSAIKEMNAAQMKILGLQQQKMQLDNYQMQRQNLRDASRERSMALNNSVNQGAGPASSGVLGGRAAIATNRGVAGNAITQATSIGNSLFGAERQYAGASLQYQTSQGISALGQSIFNASPAVGRVGAQLYSQI